MISFEEFSSLATSANVIPLVRSTLADLHTPVSSYLALREPGRPSFLFESVEPDEKIGRFSFVGVDPLLTIRAKKSGVEIADRQGSTRVSGSIFEVLAAEAKRFKQAALPGGSRFLGGFVGYLGYPAVARLERLHLHAPAPDEEDEAVFGLFASVLCFDHRRQMVTLVHNVMLDGRQALREAYDQGRKALDAMELRFQKSGGVLQKFSCDLPTPGEASDREAFCSAVCRAKQYIADGDIFQVVLSRRLRVPFGGDFFAVYRALRIINPSPYLFFLEFGQTQLAGSSPEVLVRVIGGNVQVLPIAGTRPRGASEEEDEMLEKELLADQKELAEHVMLVDLGRNDVGRISRYGTVNVPVFKRVERYSHVMHIVSEVRGELCEGLDSIAALRACFPAGTVSGAPKVRAMEIINELEPVSRGAYAGAVGYLGFDGSIDTCIAIRTIVGHRGMLSIQAGAGIVADSVPENEYAETVNKTRALLEAVGAAAAGLKTLQDGTRGNRGKS